MARRSSQKQRRRNPNAPKRGRTAWQLFFAEYRDQVAKENPGYSRIDVMRKLGEMWRHSDDETKGRFQQQYQENQAEYEEKLSTYRNEQKKKRQTSKSKQSNNKNNDNNNNNNNNNNSDDEY